MKKVLILVLSIEKPPYLRMIQTSLDTWDSEEVEGVETVYYTGIGGQPSNPSPKVKRFPVEEGIFNIGYKNIPAFKWALEKKEFDFVARVNSSCYVNKKALIKRVQELPEKDYFAGLLVADKMPWIWGGGQYLISRDVLQKIVDNADKWEHKKVEDVAMSHLVSSLGVPFSKGWSATIDKMGDGWRCMYYDDASGGAFYFKDFAELKRMEHNYFYRIKQDYNRNIDKYVMEEMKKVL